MNEIKLCALEDIGDGESAGFVAAFPEQSVAVLVVRQGDEVVAYENDCPHIGSPLDFQPGQFLNVERTHIMCATHGALFQISDGLCVSGPCDGDRLTALKTSVRNGHVYIAPEGT